MIYLEIPFKNIDATLAAAVIYNELIKTNRSEDIDYKAQIFQQSPLPSIETIGTKLQDSTIYLLGHIIPEEILVELHTTYNVTFFIINNNTDIISSDVVNACENIVRANGHIDLISIAKLTFEYFCDNNIPIIINYLSAYMTNNQSNIDSYITGRNIYHFLEVKVQFKISNFIQILNAGFNEDRIKLMNYEGEIVYSTKIYYNGI